MKWNYQNLIEDKMKSVMLMALKDISDSMKEDGLAPNTFDDVWVVTANQMYRDKSIRRMNRELGLHKINKHNNHNKNN